MSARTNLAVMGLIGALMGCSAGVARGDVLFSSLGPGDSFDNSGGRVVTGENYVSFGNVDQAMPFTTGNSAAVLTSVEIGVYHSSGDDSTDVFLMNNGGNVPGTTVLASMSINNIGTFPAVLRTATPGGSVQLDPNTTYWIVLDAHNDADLAWCFDTIGINGYAGRSGNPPGAWNPEPNDQAMAMRINGRLIPEPAALSFLAALPLLRRRVRLD